MLKKQHFFIFLTIFKIFTFILVEKSWNCYNNPQGEWILRQKVLKALANPPRIFYVPYNLAILNFLFWFLLFVICMIISFFIPPHNPPSWLPIAFLILLFISHTLFGFFSKKDSQIAQLILSKMAIFKNKIPRKLVV